MCGGSAVAVAAARPLLLLMGKSVQHLGDAGAGQVAKICNNLAMAIEMAAISEALALGAAAGLDPVRLTAVINTSSARCWASEVYNPVPGVMRGVPAAHNYQPGFNAALMAKDLRIAMQLAGAAQQPLPMGEKAAQLYQQVLEASGEPVDFGAIYKYVYNGKPSSSSSNNNTPTSSKSGGNDSSSSSSTSSIGSTRQYHSSNPDRTTDTTGERQQGANKQLQTADKQPQGLQTAVDN
eukprot:GHRR01006829.1.p1 GENE.GHRR01006829.1~~GHRR01006829.1.p1  ORF type:complete len:237 (+),score=96.58 GHRR01006829.1:603-1313(+)